MQRLEPVIQEYAWGSRTALAELLGQRSPSARPQAELWLGAHPLGPARLGDSTLLEHIAKDGSFALGDELYARFAGRLPFLLKVLAVAEPLSLQVHPSAEQARQGFAREEGTGLPRTDPRRNYKDDWHKPELVVALTRFSTLCGFRTAEEMAVRIDRLGVPDLRSTVQMLEGWPDAVGVHGVVHGLFGMSDGERTEVMAAATKALALAAADGEEFSRAHQLALKYPGDVGALVSLLLNPVVLEPGQGLYLPAGNLHAYLSGVAVEVMAASDNVLRGGLTPKHVDVPELLATLQYDLGSVALIGPRRSRHSRAEEVWDSPAAEFRLSRFLLDQGPVEPERRGPEILLCVEGTATVSGHSLPRGAALWVDAADGAYEVGGSGQVFRVTAGGVSPARSSR